MSETPARAAAPELPPYRELTVAAAVFGVIIGAVMTAAFTYVALKLGFTLPGSTVAAILGFAVLRGLLKKGSIVENNINQTIASGVNNASAGVAFTFPALFLLGEDFSVVPVLLSAIGGSFLGIVFIIPLRKQMIEFERLRFPSGIAVASLLKSPGAGLRQAQLLGGGFLVGCLFHVAAFVGVIPEEISLNHAFGIPEYIPLAFGISFASLGAGLLSGKGGLPFVFGGMLAWWVIAPFAVGFGGVPSPEALGFASEPGGWESWATWPVLYSSMLRPLGIGVLIGGALSGVIASFPALKSAIGSLAKSTKTAGTGGESDELPLQVLIGGIIAALVVLFVAAQLAGDLTLVQSLLVSVIGTIWLGLAGLIVAQATGMTDISPISGMSLIGVTIMFFLAGGGEGAAVPAIILGVAVSIGIGQCADMMSDLKSGHLVGATPKRQQMAQFAVAWMGVPVAVGVIYLLWGGGGGFGPENPDLSAPQGAALAEVIASLGQGAAPLDKYVAGTAVGLGLGIFPVAGLGVLVGLAMYLPFYITVTYGIGAFTSIALQKRFGAKWMGTTLVPVAAGFIIGEALTSLGYVLLQLAFGA